MSKKNMRAGSNFDNFLKEEGVFEEVENLAKEKCKGCQNCGCKIKKNQIPIGAENKTTENYIT